MFDQNMLSANVADAIAKSLKDNCEYIYTPSNEMVATRYVIALKKHLDYVGKEVIEIYSIKLIVNGEYINWFCSNIEERDYVMQVLQNIVKIGKNHPR